MTSYNVGFYFKNDVSLDLKLTPEGYTGYVNTGDLFNFDCASVEDAWDLIKKAAQKNWPPYDAEKQTMLEWEVAVAVTKCVLQPLCCTEVQMKPSYRPYIEKSKDLRPCIVGIGMQNTWHGVRGIPVVVGSEKEAEVGEEGDEEEEEDRVEVGEGSKEKAEEEGDDTEIESNSDDTDSPSHGASTLVEAKARIGYASGLSQVVKTCVVSSFIEHSLYPKLQAMIPTILIGL